jgi:lantibiotic modifying enzyme
VLFRPERFDPLTDDVWDETRVRNAIGEIVADADRAFDPAELWPAHEWDSWGASLPLKSFYVGAAGVVWALDALRRRGYAESRIDLPAAARLSLDLWRETPDYIEGLELPPRARAGLFGGESGLLLVAWRLAPSAELADQLLTRVRENVDSDVNEVMWGTPGTMLAALAMSEWTGEERWAEAWRGSAEALWSHRDPDGLWTHRLYGHVARSLGPAHGVVGNVLALLRGGELLAPDRHEELQTGTNELLARMARVEDGLANWPMSEGRDLVGEEGEIRLQWCCGAPGIVASAVSYLDEGLLLAGAELVWRAGPHGMDKGPGICHGTAGNGYALLKTFERTGDELWLERARRFAMHALDQVKRKPGRYSLWTGDIGVALYASDCIEGRSRFPAFDGWD